MQSIQSQKNAGKHGMSRALRLGFAAVVSLVGAGVGASACLDRPLCDADCHPKTTNIFVDSIVQNSVDKIDLLFMIDNSISMADKQQVLKEAVPDLVHRLVSPNCVVDATGEIKPTPDNPGDPCPDGSIREFTPISNIHIGVITSSLGDHGDHNTCPGDDSDPGGDITAEQQDDHSHLVATRPRWGGEKDKPDYAGQAFQAPEPAGFLDWNPTTRGGTQDITQFNTTFKMMVTAASEFGCGLESQLEAIYRFLSDPAPYQSITKVACPGTSDVTKTPCASPQGKDDALLQERAAFLRTDSLVAIIMVTDENDCSIRDTQQFFYAARQDIVLPNGSSICQTNPNDPCCYSCAASPPKGCQADPSCATAPNPDLDPINLRCFNQKQRFGLDFLYPTARYVAALKNPNLCTSRVDLSYDPTNPNGTCPDADGNAAPDVVPNPLYFNPNGLPRAQSLVFFAGIVGVPWQDITRPTDPKTMAAYPANELHYLTAAEMLQSKTWDNILGDPTASPPRLPVDGLMVESRSPRNGSDLSGKPIPGFNAQPGDDNAINAHDWANISNEDLMYACIFQLPQSRDCTQVEKADPSPGCDCGISSSPGDNNPLCRPPGTTNYGAVQYFAKAYPGVRELQVLKDYGTNSIIASICPKELSDKTAQDYGYRPAVDAIVDRLKEALTGRCLPRTLKKDKTTATAEHPDGEYPCSILEVQPPTPDGCNPAKGRVDPNSIGRGKVITPAIEQLTAKGVCGPGTPVPDCRSFQFCEIQEAGPECHQDIPNPQQPKAGWCYVDPSTNDDPKKNPKDADALVAKCAASERRIIRFVDPDNKTPAQGAQVLIACFGASFDDTNP
ncbi:MAG TPA: hypothetical protein VHE30_24190 [Polyangiaceae bacterium]|nr:hypothetical protein [Polyangiaceae bacterium]